jgi:ATP-binding cassette subfamily B protein
LYQFEDANFYDKLERARTQTAGRTALMSMVLSQAQDLITVIFLAAGLVAFNPWLLLILVVAVIPSFIGESKFNQESYSLTRSWTPNAANSTTCATSAPATKRPRRSRFSGWKVSSPTDFKTISDRYFLVNQKLALRRAGWGSLFLGASARFLLRRVCFCHRPNGVGQITVGTLTFLAGAFSRLQGLLQGIVSRFSRIAETSLYLQDFSTFLELKPLVG